MKILVCVPVTVIAAMVSACTASAGDLDLSGFVDASYFNDLTLESDAFGLDQVELDVGQEVSDATSVRADLEWVKDGEGFTAAVEQAFVQHVVEDWFTLTFGKFNAPIGFELLDAPDMYQYSHSLLFDFGLPTNLTGLMLSRDVTDQLDIAAYVVNGWDRNADAGQHLTAGGRLGLSRGGLSGGISFIGGKEIMTEEDVQLIGAFDPGDSSVSVMPEIVTTTGSLTRNVLDVDLGFQAGAWILGGEINVGSATVDGGESLGWTAFMLMGHHDFTDDVGLTARVDRFDDTDGYVFGLVADDAQVRHSITVAPTFALDEGLGALVELRLDLSDQDAWVDADGEPTDSQATVAFEVTHSW